MKTFLNSQVLKPLQFQGRWISLQFQVRVVIPLDRSQLPLKSDLYPFQQLPVKTSTLLLTLTQFPLYSLPSFILFRHPPASNNIINQFQVKIGGVNGLQNPIQYGFDEFLHQVNTFESISNSDLSLSCGIITQQFWDANRVYFVDCSRGQLFNCLTKWWDETLISLSRTILKLPLLY